MVLRGGRTNQVWQFGDYGQNKVLKLYRPADTNPLFDNDPHREVLCLKALSGTGLSPRLLNHGSHPLGHWIIYEHISGLAWDRDPASIARLLARVHAQTLPNGLQRGPNGSAEIERQTLGILRRCQPGNHDRVSAIMPKWQVSPMNHPCLIHGDPVPGNIILTAQTPVLIDWQCPTNGDPTEDIALFLSPAMQKLYRGTPLTQSEIQVFLAAYPNPSIVERYHWLKAWYHWRMAAYCLWRVDQGERDYTDGFSLECDSLSACTVPN
ncbi:MAG: phosphotransferase family protein [Paracoccaceae bacterium]